MVIFIMEKAVYLVIMAVKYANLQLPTVKSVYQVIFSTVKPANHAN